MSASLLKQLNWFNAANVGDGQIAEIGWRQSSPRPRHCASHQPSRARTKLRATNPLAALRHIGLTGHVIRTEAPRTIGDGVVLISGFLISAAVVFLIVAVVVVVGVTGARVPQARTNPNAYAVSRPIAAPVAGSSSPNGTSRSTGPDAGDWMRWVRPSGIGKSIASARHWMRRMSPSHVRTVASTRSTCVHAPVVAASPPATSAAAATTRVGGVYRNRGHKQNCQQCTANVLEG